MDSKKSQKSQHAAARRELEALGVSEARIQELERGWDKHAARLGLGVNGGDFRYAVEPRPGEHRCRETI